LDSIFCKHTVQKILKIHWGLNPLTPLAWVRQRSGTNCHVCTVHAPSFPEVVSRLIFSAVLFRPTCMERLQSDLLDALVVLVT